MTKRNGGGPAFPTDPRFQHGTGYDGMSLRQWFAGQALAGYIAHLGYRDISAGSYVDECVSEAYRFADAMIAEGSKGDE